MTSYEGVAQLILAESSITSLLGTYKGTSQPLVVVGTIPEAQAGNPAISIRNQINTGDYGISQDFIELHCYADKEVESQIVAKACYDFFRNSQGGVTGFAARFDASITGTTPSEKQTNTIVELKTTYR